MNLTSNKKSFFDILLSLCQEEGLIDKWKSEGYLLETKNSVVWNTALFNLNFEISPDSLDLNSFNKIKKIKEENTSRFKNHEKIKNDLVLNKTKDLQKNSKQINKEKKDEILKEEYENNKDFYNDYNNLFDKKNIGISGKKSYIKNVINNMIELKKEFPEYTNKDILEATKLYINHTKTKVGILYLRESMYFISKIIDGQQHRDIVKWIEEYKSGNSNSDDNNFFKTFI